MRHSDGKLDFTFVLDYYIYGWLENHRLYRMQYAYTLLSDRKEQYAMLAAVWIY